MKENYRSLIHKAWIITPSPIKELDEELKTISCKKMLNFHSEPKEFDLESTSIHLIFSFNY